MKNDETSVIVGAREITIDRVRTDPQKRNSIAFP